MAFAAASRQNTMADINITPLVDVMLVLLVIFIVTAPMLDFRIPMTLPRGAPPVVVEPVVRQLEVRPGDVFALDGAPLAPAALERELADWRVREPDGVLKIDVSPEADYQSAATAMAAAERAGVEHVGLVER